MHFLVGLLILGASLAFTMLFHESRFEGFFHPPALVLVGVAPIAIVIMGHGAHALGRAVLDFSGALAFRRPKRAFNAELAAFSDLLHQGRLAEAAAYLERCTSPLRQYGILSLERYSREQYAQVLAALRSDRLHALKDSEEVFQTLAQVTPSVGMVGTVLGLVGMLVHLQSFQELASGMALALLTTFYGLLLGRCLYSPLVSAIRGYAFSLQSVFAKLESTYALHTAGRSSERIVEGPSFGAGNGAPERGVSRARS